MGQLILERRALLESLGNDEEFLQKVIGIFLADCPGILGEIRSGVSLGDSSQVMNASHALRGSVSFFGAETASEAAGTLESMGKQGNLEDVRGALAVLEREISLVSLALEEIAKGPLDGRPEKLATHLD
jgi:histidine phosphotransfer protein HptB